VERQRIMRPSQSGYKSTIIYQNIFLKLRALGPTSISMINRFSIIKDLGDVHWIIGWLIL